MSNCFFEFHFFSVSSCELVSMYKSLAQSCPTPCDPVDYSPPGSSVHGIQTRTLEWVAIPVSRGSSWPRDRTWVSCIALLFVPPGKSPVNTEILINFLFFFKKRIVGWFVNVKLTFSSVQSLSCVLLFATPWIAARPGLPVTLGWMQPITDTSCKRQYCQIPTIAIDNGTYRTDVPWPWGRTVSCLLPIES